MQGRADDGEAEQTRRARRGREQDFTEISRRMYEEIRSSRDPRDHEMWKTSASPPSGGRPRLVAVHTHKEPCTKIARPGDLFLFTHLTVEVSVFIYLL